MAHKIKNMHYTHCIGHKCGYGPADLVIVQVCIDRTHQHEQKPDWDRHLQKIVD